MPIFFQHIIDHDTRLGIWKIEEPESFFLDNVPIQQDVHHPHKRLQHLAGRFLLRFLFPGFPYDLIKIADTRKPFLENEEFHFSISHCGDFAAAIVSRTKRVGIDIEIPTDKVGRLVTKFLSEEEFNHLNNDEWKIHAEGRIMDVNNLPQTILWSTKESVFKWYGLGQVDFKKHINLESIDTRQRIIRCHFAKTDQDLSIRFVVFDQIVLAWLND